MEQRFTEVIKVVDGKFSNIDMHKKRIHHTSEYFFGRPTFINFDTLTIPDELRQGVVKCRIVYNTAVQEVTFAPYSIRPIKTVKSVECDNIDYGYKYEDRSILNSLFEERGICDDILIIKNGLVSDTSYANVVFKDHDGLLYTPAIPLLPGTKRARLVSDKVISERDIALEDIHLYEGFYIINAMIELEDNVFIKTRDIIL